jgi:hypothetical protein
MMAIDRWADVIAIPFFFFLSLYFYKIENKSPYEWILFLFSISGFLGDILFTYMFLTSRKKHT